MTCKNCPSEYQRGVRDGIQHERSVNLFNIRTEVEKWLEEAEIEMGKNPSCAGEWKAEMDVFQRVLKFLEGES